MTIVRLAALVALAVAFPASADVVFSTSHDGEGDANCIFNTACGVNAGAPGAIVAQRFSLGQTTTLTGTSFTAVTFGLVDLPSVNWQLLFVDLNTGLPGAPILAGNSAIIEQVLNANQFGSFSGNLYDFHYSLPGVSLTAGDYYLGFQAVSNDPSVFLMGSVQNTGAATFNEGGNPAWVNNYRGIGGVAVSISGTTAAIPEPASWAMLIAGFGLVGASLRRRRAVAV